MRPVSFLPRARRAAALSLLVVAPALATAQSAAATREVVDTAAINRIESEGLGERSQVMDIASWLTDVYGPRLTNSPMQRRGADWALGKFREWGLANAHLEAWGPFGRGWTSERFALQVLSPSPFTAIAYPLAWTPGTNGRATGEAVMMLADSVADLEQYRGKLRGKFVLVDRPRDVKPSAEPLASRYTDAELAQLAEPEAPREGRGNFNDPAVRARFQRMQEVARARTKFLAAEGVLAVLRQSRGDGGTVFVQGGGSREPGADMSQYVPEVMVAVEHYGRIARAVQKGVPVTLALEAENRFYPDTMSFNVIAEIPGTDPRLKDEVVMIGAHFDTWHGGTGATDNTAGSAVMMEAMRLIKAAGLRPKRTIRIGLWTGEEQGLLGSRAYVEQHYLGEGTRKTPEHARFAGYFNVDNGTGKIRGVYLQGNEAVRPIFDSWMAPFRSMGMTTLTPRNTGGTDHLAFDYVGLPGFQFIQDEVEYGTRTHHSNMDTYERLQAEDMRHNAVVVASFAYLAATRPEKLPRKAAVTP
ncbi:MAG: M20/M25/M40 family metallo-hydrolase [Gemmatimonadaceae bacterium]